MKSRRPACGMPLARRQRRALRCGAPARRTPGHIHHQTTKSDQLLVTHAGTALTVFLGSDCPARGRRVYGAPSRSRRTRSAPPTLDTAATRKDSAPARKNGKKQEPPSGVFHTLSNAVDYGAATRRPGLLRRRIKAPTTWTINHASSTVTSLTAWESPFSLRSADTQFRIFSIPLPRGESWAARIPFSRADLIWEPREFPEHPRDVNIS